MTAINQNACLAIIEAIFQKRFAYSFHFAGLQPYSARREASSPIHFCSFCQNVVYATHQVITVVLATYNYLMAGYLEENRGKNGRAPCSLAHAR
jgi:hypothetical protein